MLKRKFSLSKIAAVLLTMGVALFSGPISMLWIGEPKIPNKLR